MNHKFKVGQLVRLLRHPLLPNVQGSGNVNEIVRLMPADRTGEFSYPIRSNFNERMALESDIVAASGGTF